jgi:hypothetical protein
MSVLIRFILILLITSFGIGIWLVGIDIPGIVIFLIGLCFLFDKESYRKTKYNTKK